MQFPLRHKYLSTVLWNILSLKFFPQFETPSFTPIKKQQAKLEYFINSVYVRVFMISEFAFLWLVSVYVLEITTDWLLIK